MSRVGPLLWLLYCAFFCLVRDPAELDSKQRLKGKGGAVPGAEASLGLNRAKFTVEMELNRA